MGNVISTIDKDLHSGSKSAAVPANSPGLQILGISPNSATLNWTTVDTATQYQVLYQVSGTTTWNNYTTTSKNVAVVTGLVSATTYNFSLSASNTYGTGAPSIVTGVTLPNVENNGQTPSAPSQFQVTGSSNTSVTLNWNSVEGAVQYQVQYQVSGSGSTSYSWLTSGVTPNLNLTVTNLLMYIPYNFTVTAINNYGAGPAANISNFQLNSVSQLAPPSAPTHFQVESNTASNVTLHWDTVSGAVQYNLMYQIVGTTTTSNGGWVEVGSTSGTISVVNNMLPGVSYNFSVISVNNYGASSQSLITNYTFPANAASGGVYPPPPGPVTVLQSSNVTPTSLTLTWSAPVISAGAGSAIQYQVLYQISGSTTWTEYQITPNTVLTITGLNSYVTYNFSVAALNNVGIGSSALLNTIQLPGPAITGSAPLPPSGFRASNIGTTNVTLNWNLVNGAVQYKVLYQVASSPTGWIEFNTTINSTLNVTGLLPLTVYNFSVIAINNYGISTPSLLSTIQLLTSNLTGVPPPSPKNLITGGVDVSSVTLSWTGLGDSAQYIVSYQVVGAPSSDWIEYECLTDSTIKVSDLLPLSMYNFNVVAINNYGNSAPTFLNNIQLSNVNNTGTAPPTPSNLQNAGLTPTTVSLTWNATVNTAQYLVQYQVSGSSTTPSGWYEFAVTEVPNVTVTGLQPYTPYNFSVTSVNNYGVSAPTLLSGVSTPGGNNNTIVPAIPTNFQVTNTSTSTVTLSWSSAENAAQYQIQYQVDGSNPVWVQGVTTGKLSTTITNLVSYIPYNLSLVAVNNYGESLLTLLKNVTLPGANGTGSPPVSPTDFQGVPSVNSVDLTWNAGVGAIQYLISYQVDGSTDWIEYQTSKSNSTTVNNLEPLVLYNFSILSLNNSGPAPTPSICKVQLLSGNTGSIAPSPVTVQVVNLTTNAATLSWTSAQSAIDYTIYYQVAGSPDTHDGWSQFATTANTNLTVTNLVAGIVYNFGVCSVNNWGSSAMSLLEAIKIPDPLPTGSIPIPPTGLQYSNLTTTDLVLNWTLVPQATTYQIMYQVDGSQSWIGWGSYSNSGVKITGLISYVTYNFSVIAVNNYGASGPSVLSKVIVYGPSSPTIVGPSGSPPSPPSNLVNGTLSSNSAVLNWTAGLNTVQYVVSYQVSGSSSWLNFGTTANTSIVVTKLLSYVNYNFSVFSLNNYGVSSSATIYNVPIPGPADSNTPPGLPTTLTATSITTTTVTLTWVAPSTATPAVQYNLLYQVVGSTPQGGWIDYGTTPNLTTTVTGLIPYLPYNFQLFAVNNYGAGSPVQLNNIKMLGTGATGTIASAPSNFKVSSASTTLATLVWDPTPTAVQYNIMYQLTGTSNASWVEISVTSSTSIVTPTLVPGVTYNFSVTAINNFGTSLPTLINNYTMPSTGVTGYPPLNPTALQVSNTTLTTASLGWIAPQTTATANPAVEYNIMYQITGSTSSDWVDYTVTTATNVTVNNLSPFITYTFKVIAVNDCGAASGVTVQATLPPAAVTGSPPASPTNLVVTAKTPTTASLSWSSSVGSVEYSVSYQITGSPAGNWNEVGVTSGTTYVVTGLSQMVTYSFEIIGINNAGTSSPLILNNTTLPMAITGTAPGVVANFHTTAVTNSSVSLAWDPTATAYEYNVYYQVAGASTWADFGVTTSTTYVVTGLTPYVTYNFEITAINNYGNSAYTQLSGIQLLIPSNAATGTAPSSPTSLTVTSTTVNTASLSWPASSTAVEYNVLYQISGSSSFVDYSIITNTSSVVSGLVPYVTYIFQVIAVNNYGASAPVSSSNTQLPIPSNAATGSAPNVPTGLSSSNATSSSVTVSWTAPSTGTAALEYNVLYQINGATSWVEYNITTSTSISVTGLNAYAIYNFQVIALNNYGASSAVNLNSVQLLIPTNAATGSASTSPSNLTVSSSTSTTATLTWSAVTGANQYNVMYQLATSSSWAETAIVNAPTVTTTITSLNPYAIYNFQVIAMNNYGQSSGSQILGYQLPATTPAGTAPSSPTNLVATAGAVASNSIGLTWSAGTSGGAVVTYNVLYQVNTSSSWYDYVLTSSTSLNVTGLAGSASYNFQVIAINNYGSSTPATVSCVGPNTTPSGIPPTAITDLSVTANSSTVTLNWTNISTAVQYNTLYRISGTTNWAEGGTSYSSPFSVPGLVFPIVYEFQVVGVNNYGASPPVSITSGVAPAAPTNLVAGTSTTTQIPFTWSGATGASSYNLTYQIGSGAVTTLTGLTSTSTTVTSLSPGTVYNFAVYSVNTYGVSSNASTVISGTVCSAPTGLAASSPTLNSMIVSWSPTIGVSTYNLSYQPAGGAYSTLPATTSTTSTLSGLTAGIVYNIYLTATNSFGTSAASSTITYGTTSPAPTGLVASNASTSTVDLSWTSSTGATSYTVGYTPSGGAFQTIPGFTTPSARVSGLNPGIVYNFSVYAVNNYSTSASSSVVTYGTLTSSPTGLTASSPTTSSLNLSWNGVVGAGSYSVFYQPAGGSYSSVTGLTGTNTTISSLNPGTVYNLYVVGVNAYGSSAASSTITYGTTSSSPTGLTASSASTSSINLSWNSTTGANSYTVSYQPSGGSTSTVTGLTGTSTTINTLSPGTIYNFQIVAVNTYATSASSSVVTYGTVTSAPATFSASNASASTIDLAWSTVVGATSYSYFYRPAGGSYTSVTGFTGLSTTLSGLSSGIVYNLYLVAVNSYGTSAASSTITYGTISPVPTGLTGSSASTGGLNLTWSGSTGANTYTVTYKPSGGSNLTISGLTGTSTSVTGLTAGTVYTFQIASVNSYGTSSASTAITYGTLTSASTGFAASSASTSGISVNWNSVVGASTYSVYYQPSGGSYSSVTGLTGTSTTVGSLNSGTVYTLYIVGVNAYGTSAASSTITYGTISSAPTGLTGSSASTSGFSVTWTAVTGANSYSLSYQPSGGSYTTVTGLTGTNTSLSTLSSGTVYNLYLTAVNTYGTSAASSTVTYGTISSAPTGLAGSSPTSSGLSLSWNGSTGATSYTVSYQPSGGSSSTVTGITTNSTAITGLSAGTVYTINVTAVNTYGSSAASSNITYGTLPSAPTGLSATAPSTSQINLSWTSVTGATTYSVSYQPSGGSYSTTTGITASSTSITGLTAGQTYSLYVTAVNTYGSGSASTTITYGTLPPAPSGLAFTSVTSTSLVASWSAAAGATSYNVSYQVSGGSWRTPVSVTGTSTTISSLSSGTTYVIQVQSVNSTYGTGLSSSASQLLLPGQVGAPTATSSGSGSASITWTIVSGATSYNLYSRTPSGSGTFSKTATGISTPYTATGLTGPSYDFEISASNATGEGAVSASTSLTLGPSAPTNFQVNGTSTSSTINLMWNIPSGADSTYSYTLSWTPSTAQSPVSITAAPTSNGSVLQELYSVTGLTNNTSYTFSVVTVDPQGATSSATTLTTSTANTPAPTTTTITFAQSVPPNGVGVKASDGHTDLNNPVQYSCGSVSKATGYKLYGAVNGGAYTQLASAANSFGSVKGLAGGNWVFYITATFAGGLESGPSATKSLTLPIQPLPIGNVTKTVNTPTATLTWVNDPLATGGYQLYSNNGGTYSAAVNLPAGSTTYTFSGVNAIYGYLIFSVSSAYGTSAPCIVN